MNKIFKLKQGLQSSGGYAGIAVYESFKKGDLFFMKHGQIWCKPVNGRGYGFDAENVMDALEFMFDTDKPEDYFCHAKYSQYHVDAIIKNNQ